MQGWVFSSSFQGNKPRVITTGYARTFLSMVSYTRGFIKIACPLGLAFLLRVKRISLSARQSAIRSDIHSWRWLMTSDVHSRDFFVCPREVATLFRLTNQEYCVFPAGDDALATGHCNKSHGAVPAAYSGRIYAKNRHYRSPFILGTNANDSDE